MALLVNIIIINTHMYSYFKYNVIRYYLILFVFSFSHTDR